MPYPTSIRLPEDVRRILRRTAKQNRRTVTEQINFVLQEWIHAGAGQAQPVHPALAGQEAKDE